MQTSNFSITLFQFLQTQPKCVCGYHENRAVAARITVVSKTEKVVVRNRVIL